MSDENGFTGDCGLPVNIDNSEMQPQLDEQGRVLLTIKEVEVAKLDLKPGQVLVITIKNDDLDEFSLNSLKASFKTIFPNNKVAILGLRPGDGAEFSILDNPEPVNYCSDCSCGKKERLAPLPFDPETQKEVDDFNDEYNLRMKEDQNDD